MIRKLKNQKGVSILLVVMILGVIIVVSLAVNDLVLRQTKLSITLGESTQAYYAAESGVEEGLYKLRNGIEFIGGRQVNLSGDSYYNMETETEEAITIIKSEGNYKETKRKIEARY